jgi:hypothetical protein
MAARPGASQTISGWWPEVFSQLQGLIKDAAGNLLAAGFASDGKDVRWIVRRSSNGGASWSTIDNYVPGRGWGANAYCVGLDAAGRIYVAGLSGSKSGSRWFVRTSADGGQTWRNSDNYLPFSGHRVQPVSMVSDSAGAMYVAGYATDNTGYRRAIIRKSADGGLSWNTISDVSLAAGYHSYERALAYDPLNNALYASGSFSEAAGSHQLIRKSTDGGATWSVMDDSTNFAYGLLVDSTGRVYATGTALNPNVYNKLYVRMSADGGQSWSLIEEYQLVAGLFSDGLGLMESGGSIYVVGDARQSGSPAPRAISLGSCAGCSATRRVQHTPRSGLREQGSDRKPGRSQQNGATASC